MNPARLLPARRVLGRVILGAVLATGPLAGCSAAPELDRDAAGQLQSQVLAVTEAAAASDPAASLKQLDELVLKLDGAAARGAVSFQRHQSIGASIDFVRADLTAQQAAAETARAAAAEAARVAAGQEAAVQAAAAAAAASVAPPSVAPSAPAGPNGNGNGKAREKSKGKDNG